MREKLGSPTNLLDHETHRLEQSKCDMHDLGLALRAQPEPTSLEQLQHLGVFRQDLDDQRLEPGCTGNSSKMTHQCPADASPLILVDHDESDLGLPGLDDNVTSATYNHRPPPFIYQRY